MLGLDEARKWRVSGSMHSDVNDPSKGSVCGTKPSVLDSWKTHDCNRWTKSPPRGNVVTGLHNSSIKFVFFFKSIE